MTKTLKQALFEVGINPGTIVFDVRSSAGIVVGVFSERRRLPKPGTKITYTSQTLSSEKIIRNLTGEEDLKVHGNISGNKASIQQECTS